MGKSARSNAEFQREVARKLRQALREKGWSQTEAAKRLGISKQAFSKYLDERAPTTPSSPVLLRAIKQLGIALTYRDWDVPQGAFIQPSGPQEPEAVQLRLFEAPKVLANGTILMKIGSKRAVIPEVTIEIRFAR